MSLLGTKNCWVSFLGSLFFRCFPMSSPGVSQVTKWPFNHHEPLDYGRIEHALQNCLRHLPSYLLPKLVKNAFFLEKLVFLYILLECRYWGPFLCWVLLLGTCRLLTTDEVLHRRPLISPWRYMTRGMNYTPFERGESRDYPNIKRFLFECGIAENEMKQDKRKFTCRY